MQKIIDWWHGTTARSTHHDPEEVNLDELIAAKARLIQMAADVQAQIDRELSERAAGQQFERQRKDAEQERRKCR